ncbi:hypothetical protein ACHQM5_008698 [Ranunculus cassubicifolius]
MDSSKSASYNAGQAQGQAAEKKDQIIDSAGNAAQSVKDSISEVRNIAEQTGQAMMDKAHAAADSVKNATGMNK